MEISLGENMEKAFRYQTAEGVEETLYVTDKKMLWERGENVDELAYYTVAQVEKTVRVRLTGGCVFAFALCLLSLLCGVATVLYAVWEGRLWYYAFVGIFGVVALVAFIFSIKLKGKDYGVRLYLDGGKELWLDIGDKKLSGIVANEIVAKVWSV